MVQQKKDEAGIESVDVIESQPLLTLRYGFENPEGEPFKDVRFMRAKGKHLRQSVNDARAQSADDPASTYVMLSQVIRIKMGEGQYRRVTFGEVEELDVWDLKVLGKFFTLEMEDAEKEAEGRSHAEEDKWKGGGEE